MTTIVRRKLLFVIQKPLIHNIVIYYNDRKDIFIFNDIHNNKIISKIYNVDGNIFENQTSLPVSHDYKTFISIDYAYLIV